jgi:hypothetical protein
MDASGVRTRNIFDPGSTEPFRLSRSKIEFFLECPRCFYLDRRRGIARPDGPPFTLNVAVDHLLKKEFDAHRIDGRAHPLMTTYGVEAVPFKHPLMDEWRDALRGVAHLHQSSNFLVFGAVDDIWQARDGKLHVVDYKATSTVREITLDDEWKGSYKRQVEVYQWLLRRNDFPVSDIAYFVYVNAEKDREAFDRRLEFTVKVLPYEGKDDWIEEALLAARECLEGDDAPPSTEGCKWCLYRRAAGQVSVS